SLLAKQGWWIIKYPNSLTARLLKGKYFPRSSFLNAELGNQPSWIWGSILHGRELLSSGLVWQLGNGQSFNFLNDNWLISSGPSKPRVLDSALRPIPGLNFFKCHGCWDPDRLKQYFSKDSVRNILLIPIPRLHSEDSLVWVFSSRPTIELLRLLLSVISRKRLHLVISLLTPNFGSLFGHSLCLQKLECSFGDFFIMLSLLEHSSLKEFIVVTLPAPSAVNIMRIENTSFSTVLWLNAAISPSGPVVCLRPLQKIIFSFFGGTWLSITHHGTQRSFPLHNSRISGGGFGEAEMM
ncbi:Uncharacterized mitochondrial protein AtMg00310, partial [Linum grandiflorum]